MDTPWIWRHDFCAKFCKCTTKTSLISVTLLGLLITEDGGRNFLRISVISHYTRRHIAEDLDFNEKQIGVQKIGRLTLQSTMENSYKN